MKIFRCTYRAGANVKAERIEAESQAQLIDLLSAKGFLILSIIEEPPAAGHRWRRGRKVKNEDLVLAVRQLATMIDAGLPLLQCLQTLEDQAEPGRFREVMHALVEDVTRGQSFSESLANHPLVFDKLFISMVRAGEAGGFLSEILDRLSTYMENAAALRRKVKSAMTYPTVIVFIAIGITVFLIVKIIPVFEKMFADFGAPLPLPTQMLIALSRLMRTWGFVMLGVVIGLFFLLRWYAKTPAGRLLFDQLKFRLPILGVLMQKIAVARFTSTLAALVESGVPIIRSLEIVSDSSGNELINNVLRDAMRRTEKGEPIADAMRASKYMPRMVTKMIEVGETTGRLDVMLKRVAAFYTDQVNTAVAGLTALIEPMLIVFLGVVVGGIVLSMFLPIFQLSNIVS